MVKKGIFGFLKTIGQHEGQSPENSAPPSERSVSDQKSGRGDKDILITDEMVQFAQQQLEMILSLSKLSGTVTAPYQDTRMIILEISSSDDIGRIIGRDGQTIDALQTLVRAIVFKKFNQGIRVRLDAGGYTNKRLEKVRDMALRLSRNLSPKNPRVVLPSMTASERREIHILFKTHERVESFSEGTGKNRHVILQQREKASEATS